MLHLITSLSDRFVNCIADDPVRPSIPKTHRIGNNRDIFVSYDEGGDVNAITCVSYQNTIPMSEGELFEHCEVANVSIFYTIWSYKSGAGRKLIFDSVDYIKRNKPGIQRFVTLSPKTEMAKTFHLKNGASIFRENPETVNYEYLK